MDEKHQICGTVHQNRVYANMQVGSSFDEPQWIHQDLVELWRGSRFSIHGFNDILSHKAVLLRLRATTRDGDPSVLF